jgi:hypothetical protein
MWKTDIRRRGIQELPKISVRLEVNMKVEAIRYEGRRKVSAGKRKQMADKVHPQIGNRTPAYCTLFPHIAWWP